MLISSNLAEFTSSQQKISSFPAPSDLFVDKRGLHFMDCMRAIPAISDKYSTWRYWDELLVCKQAGRQALDVVGT